MNQMQINSISEHHKPSFNGLISIVKTRKPFRKTPFLLSAILSTFFLVVFICNPNKSFVALEKISDIAAVCFPALLGFSLAGYTMVVGFPNNELLEEDSDPNNYTLYQVLSSFFALNIILQVIAMSIGFCVSWLISINITELLGHSFSCIYNVINILVAVVLLFVSLYTMCLTPFIAINLFSLSQVNSAFFTVKKLKREKPTS
jgi:hypothetical protein